jgi:hypothetical protein
VPVAIKAAGNERNFVHPCLAHIESRVFATDARFLAMKPPPLPIPSMIAATSEDGEG